MKGATEHVMPLALLSDAAKSCKPASIDVRVFAVCRTCVHCDVRACGYTCVYDCKRVCVYDDDRPFIVLAETKPSKRHIPVWARYSPLRTRVEAHANTLSP